MGIPGKSIMAKKPAARSQKAKNLPKPSSASVRKVVESKKPNLSKPVNTKTGMARSGKAKSVISKNPASTVKSSLSVVSPKPEAVTKTKDSTNEPAIPSVLDYQEQRARIARRAYELYEERCPPGADVQDWLRAEREIMQKR